MKIYIAKNENGKVMEVILAENKATANAYFFGSTGSLPPEVEEIDVMKVNEDIPIVKIVSVIDVTSTVTKEIKPTTGTTFFNGNHHSQVKSS
jgi:hypothetical protein